MDRGCNKDGEALVVSMAPDVCLTPMGAQMVPVPYNITSQFGIAVQVSTNVNYGGLPAFTMASRLPTVKGDEPGVGGGVVSGVNLGFCKPVQHSGTYRVNGEWVVRHGDQMEMNCAGPDGAGNTIGQIIYVGVGPVPKLCPDEPPDDDEEEPNIEDDPDYKQALEDIKKAEEEVAAAKKEAALLAAETALDIAGIFDPTPTSDTLAAGMALNRGDYFGAGLNVLSWIPYVGDAVAKPLKGIRSARTAAKIAEKISKMTAKLEKLKDMLKALKDKLKAKLKKPKKTEGPPEVKDGAHIPKKFGPGNLPKDPDELLKNGWKETTDPRMARNSNSREFVNEKTGQKLRFDKGQPGANGYAGQDHYHAYNPSSTGNKDLYLDSGGNAVSKGSSASHLLP